MTTWVLLRGLSREAGHWDGLDRQIAARLGPGHTVLALDLPGNGGRHHEPSPASVTAMVLDCRAQLARRGAAAPYVLVALSLGGMVALEWCRTVPQELQGGVLINTSLRGRNPFWQRLRPANYLRLARLLLPGVPARLRESLLLAMTSSDPVRQAMVLARWTALAERHPVTRMNMLRQLAAAARYRPPVSAPGVPLLLLASAGDRLVSPTCSQRIAGDWGLPLRIHPSAGHDLPLDDAPWVLRQILAWHASLSIR